MLRDNISLISIVPIIKNVFYVSAERKMKTAIWKKLCLSLSRGKFSSFEHFLWDDLESVSSFPEGTVIRRWKERMTLSELAKFSNIVLNWVHSTEDQVVGPILLLYTAPSVSEYTKLNPKYH